MGSKWIHIIKRGPWCVCMVNTQQSLTGSFAQFVALSIDQVGLRVLPSTTNGLHVDLADNGRADSRLAPSQWETSLQSNALSHWLGANLKSSLNGILLCQPYFPVHTALWHWARQLQCVHIAINESKFRCVSFEGLIRRCHSELIHWTRHKLANILQTSVSCVFSWKGMFKFLFKFRSHGWIWAITWTNYDPIHWHISASLGVNVLCFMYASIVANMMTLIMHRSTTRISLVVRCHLLWRNQLDTSWWTAFH